MAWLIWNDIFAFTQIDIAFSSQRKSNFDEIKFPNMSQHLTHLNFSYIFMLFGLSNSIFHESWVCSGFIACIIHTVNLYQKKKRDEIHTSIFKIYIFVHENLIRNTRIYKKRYELSVKEYLWCWEVTIITHNFACMFQRKISMKNTYLFYKKLQHFKKHTKPLTVSTRFPRSFFSTFWLPREICINLLSLCK